MGVHCTGVRKCVVILPLLWIISLSVQGQEIVIWASKVVDVSSEFEQHDYSAVQALYRPNVFPMNGGDDQKAWRPKLDNKEDYLTVAFKTLIKPIQIAIFESENPSAIRRVYAYDTAYNEFLLLELRAKAIPYEWRILHLFINKTDYLVQAIKVEIDGSSVPGYNAIDAIGISESDVPIQLMYNRNFDEETYGPSPSTKPNTSPQITITSPHQENGVVSVNIDSVKIDGQATDEDGISELRVNGALVELESDGSFSSHVKINVGANNIGFIVVDKRGKTSYKTIQINRELEEEEIQKPKYYGLILTINDYEFNDVNLRDLQYPNQDGKNLANLLTSKYGFEYENLYQIENPKRSELIDAFEKISNRITERDNLLVFFAGHGIWDKRIQTGYWLPADARSESKANWISNSTVRDYISGLKTKHTLLIADACFSGSIFNSRSIEGSIDETGFAKLYRLPSRKAITSGTLNTVPDESKFMEYLLRRLKENEMKYLPARKLFSQIETPVINNTNNVPQYGTIQNSGDEGGDFIFIFDN